jgi:hypothetical protein
MVYSKLTVKLLFVLLFLLAAGAITAPAVGKTATGICWDDCSALDDACRAAGASPVACEDGVHVATHTCASLSVPNGAPYVAGCQAQGGTVTGTSGGAAVCTKFCL